MDSASLEELAASIRVQGLMQPILVRPVSDDRYEIIAGERRWRAAQMAGLTEVSTLIRDIPDEAALAMALIENIQREEPQPARGSAWPAAIDRRVLDDSPAGGRCRWTITTGGIESAAFAAVGSTGAGTADARGDRHGSRARPPAAGGRACRSSWRSG
jgi:hypothetical protein